MSCSRKTILAFLRNEGIMHFKSLIRPFINETTARKRLHFARRFVHMSTDFWKSWTFSDEVIIARGEGQRRTWCFCKPVRKPIAIVASLTVPSTRDYSDRMFRPVSLQQGIRRCFSVPSAIAGAFQWSLFTAIRILTVAALRREFCLNACSNTFLELSLEIAAFSTIIPLFFGPD